MFDLGGIRQGDPTMPSGIGSSPLERSGPQGWCALVRLGSTNEKALISKHRFIHCFALGSHWSIVVRGRAMRFSAISSGFISKTNVYGET